MMRLLKYELKRLMLNKFYVGLMLITGVYAWQILTGDIIRGIGYTAPFSPWSFGYYLASITPLLSLALLFFLTFLHRPAEKRAAQITRATPMDPRVHLAIRFAAMAIGYATLALLVMLEGYVFYGRFFQIGPDGTHVIPALLTLFPCFLFVLGVGSLSGRMPVWLAYGLILLCMLVVDFTGAAYLSSTPVTLPVGMNGEPVFVVQHGFLAGRMLLAMAGAGCVVFTLRKGWARV